MRDEHAKPVLVAVFEFFSPNLKAHSSESIRFGEIPRGTHSFKRKSRYYVYFVSAVKSNLERCLMKKHGPFREKNRLRLHPTMTLVFLTAG